MCVSKERSSVGIRSHLPGHGRSHSVDVGQLEGAPPFVSRFLKGSNTTNKEGDLSPNHPIIVCSWHHVLRLGVGVADGHMIFHFGWSSDVDSY